LLARTTAFARACQGENCSDTDETVLVGVTQEKNEEEEEREGKDEMLINGPNHLALCLSLLFPLILLFLQLLLSFYIE
jgi:hypothetical protein